MERYDIAIIGTGPAGLSAALTAKARNKNFILLGDPELSFKVTKAHTVKNYLGLPDVSGEDMQKAFLNHLKQMDIAITDDKINAVYAMGKYFALQGKGAQYEATSVILATGVSAVKALPGEMENLGRGVSYCATCDAALYKGKEAIVVAYSEKEAHEAEFLAEIAQKVYYVQMYNGKSAQAANIEVLTGRTVESVSVQNRKATLKTSGGDLTADGVFLLRENIAVTQLVPGLAVTDGHVDVDRSMKTNIAGLFACGDITGAPFQYIKSAGEGNVAALSAVSYLANNGQNNG